MFLFCFCHFTRLIFTFFLQFYFHITYYLALISKTQQFLVQSQEILFFSFFVIFSLLGQQKRATQFYFIFNFYVNLCTSIYLFYFLFSTLQSIKSTWLKYSIVKMLYFHGVPVLMPRYFLCALQHACDYINFSSFSLE